MPIRSRIEINDQLWHAPQHLSLETGQSMNGIADAAFRGYLRPLRRATTLMPSSKACG